MFRAATIQVAWYAKYLRGVPGLLLAPAVLAIALVVFGLLLTAFAYRLTEIEALAFILLVLFGTLGADMVRYRSASKSAQLVVADCHEGSPAFDTARQIRQVWREPAARLGLLRTVAFFILLFCYLWLIGALLRWLKHAA